MKNPRFSIIVPVYNVEKYVEKAISSILNQTYTDFELIIINDGSTDDSERIILSKFNDERIKYFNQTNKGLSYTRNRGVSLSKGDYIAFMDSDDYYDVTALETLSLQIDKNINVEIVAFPIRITYDDSLHKDIYLPRINNDHCASGTYQFLRMLASKTYYPASWSYLYSRNLLVSHKLKFIDGIIHEDEAFSPVAITKAKNFISINSPVYNYRIREGSITTSNISNKNIIGLLSAFNCLHSNDSFITKVYSYKLLGRALIYDIKINGDTFFACKYLQSMSVKVFQKIFILPIIIFFAKLKVMIKHDTFAK